MIRLSNAALLSTLLLALAACSADDAADGPSRHETSPAASIASRLPASPVEASCGANIERVDGHAFPDKVIALTWDDGPDAMTLDLAEYLASQRVSATFFVVRDWVSGVSTEPGAGTGVFETGYSSYPILDELVRLGHRVANHTLNHVTLSDAKPETVAYQLRANEDGIEPSITNELHLFRAPGGYWSAADECVKRNDPELSQLVGPVHWDIDRKDWEGSLYCRSSYPGFECERSGPNKTLRVKPSVIAHRYLSSIERAGHGIVLLHDRVGHVGSAYAIEIAEILIPELRSRGFVFAAPVLRFSSLKHRSGVELAKAPHTPIVYGDINGDGRADACTIEAGGVACALSLGHTLGPYKHWAIEGGASELRLGDINGDGRADVCMRTHSGVDCAFSTGHSFTKATTWMNIPENDSTGFLAGDRAGSLALTDVNGDGRADLCGAANDGAVCGLAP